MSEQTPRRRLAAIMAADVVGYSRLMQVDEAGTLAALKARRTGILQPLVTKHHGRVVKLVGDGALVEFASAVDAVECAVQLQGEMAVANAALPEDRRIVLRIGINLGDVLVEGSDLYGDGVNIAARLEPLSDPGGIVVSDIVHGQVRGKILHQFTDLGEQTLKNIAVPVRVYAVMTETGIAPAAEQKTDIRKPSIAVLPFTNMSGDPDQEYFSDGITEDVITDLSKVSTLNVVSRNTSFAFKGKATEVGQISRQLRVGFVVEGSVRKAGNRLRIAAQLIDAQRDSHVWAERYDRDISDVFALQDEISAAIVKALKVKLLPEEKKAIESRSTQNPRAYELYLLARSFQPQYTARSLAAAIRYAQRALEIDPLYARAWALVAVCQAFAYSAGVSEESGLPAAEKAISLDPTLAQAHAARGRALAESGRFWEALQAHEESLRLEPDSFDVQASFGRTCMHLGRYEAAIEHFERAAQLDETDYACLSQGASCYQALGRQQEVRTATMRGVERKEKRIALHPDDTHALALGAIDLSYLGEKERAMEWASRALAIEPDDLMTQYNLACAMSVLGELDRAFELLEKYIGKVPAFRVSWIKRDPDLVPLHGHPRYQAIVARGEARLAAAQSDRAAKRD